MTPTKNVQIIIIDDDLRMETRPLYEELVEKYGQEQIIWKASPEEGLNFVEKNLGKKTIIILDYDLGSKNSNGFQLFQTLQAKSALLYIILNTAHHISIIPIEELKILTNSHIMALMDKTDGYEATLLQIEKGIHYLNNRVDSILEEWILRHEFFTREKPYMRDPNGKLISLNDVLNEIRQDSAFGRKMSSNIISIAIASLQKDIDKIDKKST